MGAMLSGEIVRRGAELPDSSVDVAFVDTVGQSFDAFLVKNVTFRMNGLANDCVGKILSGKRSWSRPRTQSQRAM